MAATVPRLPRDIVYLIGIHSDEINLLSMLLTGRAVNLLLTPFLYKFIDLNAWDTILRCVQTLATPPKGSMFQRDLAKYVRSFVIQHPSVRRPYYAFKPVVYSNIYHSVVRMVNLRRFTCNIWLEESPVLLQTLTSHTFPSLRSVEIDVSVQEIDSSVVLKTAPQESVRPAKLHSLKLLIPQQSTSALQAVFHDVLTSCAKSLKSLALVCEDRFDSNLWNSILPSDHDTFFALEELVIEHAALTHSSLQNASGVLSLKVLKSTRSSPPISATAFPALRKLSCSTTALSEFLSASANPRRPIDTVHLGHVSHVRPWTGEWSSQSCPRWSSVLGTLHLLQNSAVPVKSLSLEADRIPIADFPAVVPHFKSLETLVMISHTPHPVDWLDRFASDAVAHMPSLHTLIAFDDPTTGEMTPAWGALRLAEAVARLRAQIPAFEARSAALRRVAFSVVVECQKREDGWYWFAGPGHGCGGDEGPLNDADEDDDGDGDGCVEFTHGYLTDGEEEGEGSDGRWTDDGSSSNGSDHRHSGESHISYVDSENTMIYDVAVEGTRKESGSDHHANFRGEDVGELSETTVWTPE